MRAARPEASRWLATLVACVCVAAGACQDEPRPAAVARSTAALAPPFARTGATQDLLCDLARAARGEGAADAPCTCDDVPATGSCGHVALGHDRRRALLLEPGTTLTVPLDGGAAQALRFSAGAPGGAGGAIALRVTVRGRDGDVVGSWHRRSVREPAGAMHRSRCRPRPPA